MTPANQLSMIQLAAETIMSMRFDVKQPVVSEPVPGETTKTYPTDSNLPDQRCYAWNRRSPGVLLEPPAEMEELEWRLVVPMELAEILTTEDLISEIRESDGSIMDYLAYPLTISQIYYRRSHILLTAKERR